MVRGELCLDLLNPALQRRRFRLKHPLFPKVYEGVVVAAFFRNPRHPLVVPSSPVLSLCLQ